MMNFDGLDPGLGDYAAGLHEGLEPGLDSTLDPALLQAVELDPDAMAVPVAEGMYSELHSVASEVGVPVTATHFDLHEELLWIGNHRVPDTSKRRTNSPLAHLVYSKCELQLWPNLTNEWCPAGPGPGFHSTAVYLVVFGFQ